MSRNNDVFHLLTTKGNQAVLAKDQRITALLPGQIGIFDYGTNISFDATSTVIPRNFYLAVGIADGTGATGDVLKSAGSHIQGKNIVFYSFRPYTPGQSQKTVLRNYIAQCETEYGIKLELRNQEIYRTQGYNGFIKTYTMKTSCCDGCTPTCPSGDSNEITRQLLININNDASGLVVARALARQALVAADIPGLSGNLALGAVVSDANLAAIMAYNALQEDSADFLYTDLEIETVSQSISDFSSVSLKYFYPRQTVALVTKVAGFECTGSIDVTQQAVFEEGNGIDVKQLEYMSKGWTESPYRLSTVNGVADDKTYITDASAKYDFFSLAHDQFSLGAWLEYYHNQSTLIAVPTADTVTRNGIAVILDKVAVPQGFEALTDDAAAAVTSTTTIERTTDKTVLTDGLS